MKRISNFINSCVGVGILMQSVAGFCATKLSVEEIYNYASQKNMRELKKLKNSMDSVDSEGNTALCQAILNKDVKTYNALVRAGANTSAACIKNIPQTTYNNFMTSVAQSGIAGGDVATAGSATATATPTTGTFLGMGALGWGITGAVVVAGIAAAAGGGGGGGGAGGASAGGSAATCGGNTCGIHSHCSNNVCVCDDGYGKNGSGECVTKGSNIIYSSNSVNNEQKYYSINTLYVDQYGMLNPVVKNGYDGSGRINISNISDGSVYGILGQNSGSYNALSENDGTFGDIVINNVGNGNVYGIYTSAGETSNAKSTGNRMAWGTINIRNRGSGSVYGINSNGSYAFNGISMSTGSSTAEITISNQGDGKSYGIYSTGWIYNGYAKTNHSIAEGRITMYNLGNGIAYGLYTPNNTSKLFNGYQDFYGSFPVPGGYVKGGISMYNAGNGSVSAMNGALVFNNDRISISNIGNGIAVGIYGYDDPGNGTLGSVINTGKITVDRHLFSETGISKVYSPETENGGLVIGIYAGKGTYITNTGDISISGADVAYGIYAKGNGGTITNSGTIDVKATNAYGIFVENGAGTTVYNTGTIKLNDVACAGDCSGNTTNGNYIVLNGGTLLNAGVMSAQSFNTASVGGNVVATTNSKWNIKNDFSGTLEFSANLTTHGFNTTYIAKDMINAGDTSSLQLKSQSALFDASLQGSDVLMRMKNFETVTTNSSFAQFLATNYALGQNEAFFNTLKQIGSVSELTSGLDKMMGKEILSRFNFEDMTMMRELNFDMNEKLFNNKEQNFASAGSVSSMAFKGDTGSNAKYSLYNKRSGNTSIGLGVAFTNVRSDDEHDNNSRRDLSYQMIVPIGYRIHGFNLMTSPRLGYARGSYDRTGFDNKSYDGTIEKRIFGLMNEARYPFMLGSWKFEPSVEFNALGYEQKGSEEKKEFSLIIPKQTTYSLESGIGLYMTHETELEKNSMFKIIAGISAYHEFADPYKVDVGMNGLTGHFTLRDENRSNNRAVARTGFEFDRKDYSFSGSFISYVDKEVHSRANLGFKWKF